MKMTAAEVTAARERLGLTAEQLAAELHLTQGVIDAWERGTLEVPRGIARILRWRAAREERQAVLAASGLPLCPTAEALDQATVGKEGDAFMAAARELTAHAESCPVCRARVEYVERHAPPLPEFPMSRWMRVLQGVFTLIERLPAPLRPPEGSSGNGRRLALMVAAGFSALALAIGVLFSAAQLARAGWIAGWWREPARTLAVVIPAYFIGFFLAGAVYDALRPIGHRFIGYVLRWGIGGTLVYGTIALSMPLLDDKPMSLADSLTFTLFLGGVWAVIGAGIWIKDRAKGKIPKRTT